MANSKKLDWSLLLVLLLAVIASEGIIKPVVGWTKVKLLSVASGGAK